MNEPTMFYSMTGLPIKEIGDGIWDDGEWISWEWINEQLVGQLDEPEDEPGIFPAVQPKGSEILWLLNDAIKDDEDISGPSPLWGKIGELYAAERFGIVLSRDHSQGHDGHLGKELVEIRTISPGKRRAFVRVKRAGNFSLLAVVQVNADYRFDARLVRRDQLPKGDDGKFAAISWGTACKVGEPNPPAPRS
jgi:hypothetical protein